jgi:tyrosine-protein kinase Etk/Wzc
MDDATRPSGGADKGAVGMRENADCSSGQQDIGDEINLVDYLRVISKYRRMIFWICTIAVVTTAIVSLFLPKSYAATASIVPPVDLLQKESVLLGAVKNPLLRQAIDVTTIAGMYVGILRSRSVVDALIERFDLATVYGIKGSVAGIRQVLSGRTSIKVGGEGIVNITVEDRDPCLAATLANAYVEELDRQNKRLFVGQASSKKVFLENRLKEMEQELSRVDNLLSRDAKNKEMLFELLTKEYEIAKIEEAKSMPTIQVLDKAVVPEKKCKPKRKQIVLLAGVTSLFVSVLAAFVREQLAYS